MEDLYLRSVCFLTFYKIAITRWKTGNFKSLILCNCGSGSHFGNIDSTRLFLLVSMIVTCQHNLLIYPREIIFNFLFLDYYLNIYIYIFKFLFTMKSLRSLRVWWNFNNATQQFMVINIWAIYKFKIEYLVTPIIIECFLCIKAERFLN